MIASFDSGVMTRGDSTVFDNAFQKHVRSKGRTGIWQLFAGMPKPEFNAGDSCPETPSVKNLSFAGRGTPIS